MTKDAYAAEVARLRTRLIEHAAHYLGARHAAAELVDQCTENGLLQCSKITDCERYMWKIVRNAALNHLELRRHIYELPLYLNDEGSPLEEHGYDPDEGMRLDVARAIQGLPVELRRIALLYYREQWTQIEIADHLNIYPMAMFRLLDHINGLLRETLSAYATKGT